MDLKFWQQVKEEFEISDQKFLCHGSSTFKCKWRANKAQFFDLAEKFNSSLKLPYQSSSERIVLFSPNNGEIKPGVNAKEHRIRFITWVINELSA